MSSDVEAAELIRAHAKQPLGRVQVAGEAIGRAELLTPACGDRIELLVGGDADGVRVTWSGRGCEVSQGSASLLVDELDGAAAAVLRERAGAFLLAMGERRPDPALGQEAALLAVAANPVRSVCATLAWRALLAALDDGGLR